MADCSTFDTLVVDWLYDELDPAEAARITRHVDGCATCWQTAESLVHMRALIRAVPEEEPPAAISARVLREAAAHAASRNQRGLGTLVPTWITGAFGRVWAHPAAAAVASLVLVAGVAGALLARDRLEMAVPRVESAAVQHRDGARGENGAAAGATGGSEGSLGMSSPAAEAVHPPEMAAAERDDEDMRERGRVPGTRAPLREGKRAAERARPMLPTLPAPPVDRESERDLITRADDAEEQTVLLAQEAAEEVLLEQPGRRSGGVARGGPAGAGKDAFAQAPEAAAPRRKAVVEPAGQDKSERAQSSATTGNADARLRTETWVESRHAALRVALRDQQCTRAVEIANDIQAREPGYYRSQLASSKELAACRGAGRKAANQAGQSQEQAGKQRAGETPKAGGSTDAE